MAILTSLGLRVAAVAACAWRGVRAPQEQGEGDVAEIIDGRNFRLTNRGEIRRLGIEGLSSTKRTARKRFLCDPDRP